MGRTRVDDHENPISHSTFLRPNSGSKFGCCHLTRMLAAALIMLAFPGCADMAADNCRTFGYDPGTDEFIKCAQNEMNEMRSEYRHMVDQANQRVAGVLASRLFAGPDQYPPEEFAAYGILAFGSRASPHDRARHLMICEAYMAGLPHSSGLTIPRSYQMATVWPVDSASTSDILNRMPQNGLCEIAVERYDLTTARTALHDAARVGADTSGIGPFLLAWSPSTNKGKPDALVLVADLSDVTTYPQAQEFLLAWSHDIEQDPSVWRNGWSLAKVRMKIRLWADTYGAKILSFAGNRG